MEFNVKDHVKGISNFRYYRDGQLWYETDTGVIFPIPVSDTGTATFNATEKSIFFMRWIRPFLKTMAQGLGL